MPSFRKNMCLSKYMQKLRKEKETMKQKKKKRKTLKEGAAFCLPEGDGAGFQGSLTIEASLSLTLFLVMAVLLAIPMDLLNTQRKIQMAVEVTARELSRQAGIFYQEEEREKTEEVLLWDAGIEEVLSHAILAAVGTKRIQQLDCSGTQVSENGEWIDLRAEYRLTLPFSVFTLDSISFSARSRKRGWIGREGGYWQKEKENEENFMVYIGKASTRYHLSPECHYLSNEISAVPWKEAKNRKNKSGSYYKPCRVCGKEADSEGMVYLFPNGEYYHCRKDCSSVRAYIKRVPLEKVKNLGVCSYCGGGS